MMCLLMKKHTTHHSRSCLSTENKPKSIKPLDSIQEIQRQRNILNKHHRKDAISKIQAVQNSTGQTTHFLQQIQYQGKKESQIKNLQVKRFARNNFNVWTTII